MIPKPSTLTLVLTGTASALTGYFGYKLLMKRTVINMEDKAIFISGCDSGFGYSLARFCQEKMGFKAVIAGCYVKDGDGKRDLASRSIEVVDLDVTEEESVEEVKVKVERILKERDCVLWAVVNNASTLVFAEVEWQPVTFVRRQFDVNLIGAISLSKAGMGTRASNPTRAHLCSKAFLPVLRRTHGSRIVNMISFCADCPMPSLSVYTATKSALRSLSAGMRMELDKFGVKVIMFNPGDHPEKTPLCSAPTQRRFYADFIEPEVAKIPDYESGSGIKRYFDAYRSKAETLFPPRAEFQLTPLKDDGLYGNFEAILRSKEPKAEYVNSNIATRSFFALTRVLPVYYADKMRIAMMQLPKF